MNKYLTQLVELSEYDRQLDGFKPKIANVEKSVNSKKEEIESIGAEIANLTNEIAELKSQISQTNAHISNFSSKIKNAGKKSSSVKTEKEIKALSVEEEIAKEQLEAANDEIARLEKIITNKTEAQSSLQEKQTALNAEFVALQESLNLQMQEIEKERSVIYTKRDKLVSDMNQKMLSFYEKIRKWAGNSAVTPVRKQACYGCFMRINDKTYSAVIRSDDIVTCPYCGRILYKEAE